MSSPYGPAKESARQLEKMFGIKPSKSALEEDKIRGVISGLQSISGSITGGLSGVAEYKTKKAMAGQYLARLVETGRLSDADRKFYQKQLPTLLETVFTPSVAQAKLNGVIDSLKRKLGVENINDWQIVGVEGQ